MRGEVARGRKGKKKEAKKEANKGNNFLRGAEPRRHGASTFSARGRDNERRITRVPGLRRG